MMKKPNNVAKQCEILSAEKAIYSDPVEDKDLRQTYEVQQQGTCLITFLPSDGSATLYMVDITTVEYANLIMQILEFQPTERYHEVPQKPGEVYGIMQDGILSRATSISADQIRLIDSGDVLKYDEQPELFKLPIKMQKHPALAICCRQVGIKPSELKIYKTLAYKVVAIDPQNTLVLQLHDTPHDDTALSEKLFDELDLDGNYADEIFDPMQLSFNVIPQDDDRICKHYDPALKGCFKGAKCKLAHVPRNMAGWSGDRKSCDQLPEQELLPNSDASVMLLPCNIVSVVEFYAHRIPETVGLSPIQQLHRSMNSETQKARYKAIDTPLGLCDLVIARDTEDQQWYRARVIDVLDRKVRVFFVDFGNSMLLGKENLRKWETAFSFLPAQVFHCRISNIGPLKEKDAKAAKALGSKILDVPISARILSHSEPYEVLIFDDDGFDIGKALITECLAKPDVPWVTSSRRIPG